MLKSSMVIVHYNWFINYRFSQLMSNEYIYLFIMYLCMHTCMNSCCWVFLGSNCSNEKKRKLSVPYGLNFLITWARLYIVFPFYVNRMLLVQNNINPSCLITYWKTLMSFWVMIFQNYVMWNTSKFILP